MSILTADISEVLAKSLEEMFKLLAYRFIFRVIVLIAVVSLITWIVKKIWYAGSNKNKKKQQREWEKYQKKQIKIEKAADRKRARAQSKDNKKGSFTSYQKVTWYPTGWTWNDEKQLWEPPDYLAKESKDRWEWDPEKGIWKDKSK